MDKAMMKKELQKVIGNIRKQRQAINPKVEFPKAMMTGQQMAKNTATVNCGGEWQKSMNEECIYTVVSNEEFKKFCIKWELAVSIENTPFGTKQIRLNY